MINKRFMINKRDINERSCVVCKKKAAKSEFIAITKMKNGDVLAHRSDNALFGRSLYVCNGKCLEDFLVTFEKRKYCERLLKVSLSEPTISQLKNFILKQNE